MGQREQTILAVYAPDIVLVAETEDCHKSLIGGEATKIGFVVNENQTKSMIVPEKVLAERGDISKRLFFRKSP